MTEPHPRVALSDSLLDSYGKLPRQIQPKVQAFIVKYRQNPYALGLHQEQVKGSRNLFSVRIDKQYRGIIGQASDASVVVLLHVDNHDAAYNWALRHKWEVNTGSGTLEVFEVRQTSVPRPQTVAAEPAGVLDEIRDRQFLRLGIQEELIPVARTVTDEAAYERVKERFNPEAQQILYMLLAGYSFSEALEEQALSQVEEKIDPEDIAAALARPSTQAQFWVVEDEEELKRMLSAPQEKWRVFLHPSQRRLVDRHWNGPVRVLGGAGTGKTVVAMHRAKWLLNNHAVNPENRILFLTFTANLAANLKSNLQSLITSEDSFRRLEVVHLDRWVYRFLRQQEFPQEIVYDSNDDRLQESWKHGLEAQEKGFERPLQFYQDEWQRVVLDQGLFTRDAYLRARRTGRCTPLTRPMRARVWKVFEAYRAHLRLEGFIEKEEAYYAARNIVETKATPLSYVSVVVDEAQDFGNEAFRLINTLAHAAGSADTPDSSNRLFLVGDAHQRIYDRQVVLSHCGIQIRGRSSRLRINYRTSESILKTAVSVLKGVEVDDLDGGVDSFQGYRSLFGGPTPELIRFDSLEDAAKRVAAWVEALSRELKYQYADFCLVARTHGVRDLWEEQMRLLGSACPLP